MHTSIDIVFYTKPGCHLCEDVEDVLDALATRHPLSVHAVDITQDADLYSRYWSKIPVVIIGDTMLQAPIAPQALQSAVVQAGQERR